MNKIFTYIKDVGIYFIGTLAVLTLAQAVAQQQAYIYFAIMALWFFVLLYLGLRQNRLLLRHDWQVLKRQKLKNSLLIIGFFILLEVMINLLNPFFNQFVSAKPKYPTYDFPINTWLGIIMSLVTGLMNIGIAVFEELSYRHDLFYRYKSEPRMVVLSLLVLSSLLFGFSHFYNFNGSLLGTLLYAVAGLFFGCIYLVTENIWVPILVHVLFNSVSLISAIFLLLFKIIGIAS